MFLVRCAFEGLFNRLLGSYKRRLIDLRLTASFLSNSAIRKRKMNGVVILSLALWHRDISWERKSRKARVAGRAYKPAKNQTINLELGAAVMPLGLND